MQKESLFSFITAAQIQASAPVLEPKLPTQHSAQEPVAATWSLMCVCIFPRPATRSSAGQKRPTTHRLVPCWPPPSLWQQRHEEHGKWAGRRPPRASTHGRRGRWWWWLPEVSHACQPWRALLLQLWQPCLNIASPGFRV